MNFKTSNLPPILELAERIRNGETAEQLCAEYDVAIGTLKSRFGAAGFSPTTGHALNAAERPTLEGGHTGAGGPHVGGGDWNRGLPTEPAKYRGKPVQTGLDWDTINAQYEANNGPRDDSIWAKGNVQLTGGGTRRIHSYVEAEEDPELPQPAKIDVPVIDRDTEEPIELPEPGEDSAPVESNPLEIPADLDAVILEDLDLGRYDEPEPTPAAPQEQHQQEVPAELTKIASDELDLGRRKFTEAQTADIVHRYKLGESANAIATTYHVQPATIRRALTQAGVEIRSRAQAAALRHNPDIKDSPKQHTSDQSDVQTLVIADIEARRATKSGRHSNPDHDFLFLLYHGLIDALLDLKQALIERDATPTPMELARQDRVRGAETPPPGRIEAV